MNWWISFVTTLTFIFGWKENQIFCARILALMPVPSPSHHIWNRALTLALAARGHHVTVVTPDPEKEPVANYTEIIIEGAYDIIQEKEYNYELMSTYSNFENSMIWFHWGQDACDYAMGTEGIKKLLRLKGKEHFDLIVIDQTLEECFLSFAPLFDSPPIVAISAYVSPPWMNTIVGNPQMLSYTNTYILRFTDHMTFMQRMTNFFFHNLIIFYWTFYHIPAMDNIARKHLGDSAVVPSEIIKENISVVMVNTHFSLDYPRPIVPAMIQVGGMQVKPGKKLPKDIEKFLDEAQHGAIFFSLGTNVRSDKLSNEKLEAFIDAFSELPQRVLWKFESASLPNLPPNIMVKTWMPQNDILAHPNVCLFISHAGMLSTQEAMYHGVPVVGMPFLADQHANIFKIVSHGVGEKLDYQTATKQSILKIIRQVLDNPSYKENMKKVSTIYRDQPETPLERAVYWTEYVLRHKGAKHLRAHSVDMPLYEYLLLDILAVLFIGLIAVIFLFFYKENMKKVSTIYRDQPETPLERAVYWTEYVLRHKGAKHLRAHSVDMPLYEYLLLDIIAVLFIGLIAVIFLFLLVLKTIYRLVIPDKSRKSLLQALKMNWWISFVTTLTFIVGWKEHQILGARILALMPVPSPSHQIWNRALTLALAARGHHVTVVTPDPEKEPVANYTEIIIEGAYDIIQEKEYNYELMSTYSNFKNSMIWFYWGQDACEYIMGTKGIKKLLRLKGKEHFDLIVIDQNLEECFLSFAPLFDSPPIVAIAAFVSPPWLNTIVGNPQMLSYTNTYLLCFTDHMTFMQRMTNFFFHNLVIFYWTFYHIPAMDNIARKHLGDSAVVPSEIIKENISVVMVNTHFTLDYPRPIVPAMIQVGGMHVKPGKKLPKDIEKFLDEAQHGAIFFSLGTNVRSDKLSNEKLEAFIDAFSELPQRVLWKFESASLPNLPPNIMVKTWMPQNDILAHPNVCLFISHAGMLSTQEAMYHGVPVVGMPFLADQHANIFKIVSHGVGEKLDYQTATKQSILKIIRQVLDNPSYKENMKKVSTIYRDQPETPLERAVYWTEYVLRHKGAKHLRAHSVDMPLYEYLLLDIIAVLFIGLIAVIFLFLLVLKTIYRLVIPAKSRKTKMQ